jgi:hypothetical protein
MIPMFMVGLFGSCTGDVPAQGGKQRKRGFGFFLCWGALERATPPERGSGGVGIRFPADKVVEVF